MKKIFILAALIAISLGAAAQHRIELYGGWSNGSKVGDYPSVSGPTPTIKNTGCDSSNDAVTIGINVRIIKKLHAGVSWTGLNSYTAEFGSPREAFVKERYTSNTLMANVKYEWLALRNFHFYSGAGIGATFFSSPDRTTNPYYDKMADLYKWVWNDSSSTRLAWQISYLGIDYSFLPFMSIFAEGGFGYRGAIMAGVKFNL